MFKHLLTFFTVLTLSSALGCGDHDHDHHSPNEEACEHMKNGPSTTITAGASADQATDTSHDAWEHKRVDLTLVADGDNFVGFVKYEAETAGDYLFFANGESSVKIAGEGAEASAAVSECSDVSRVDTFELEVGEHVVEITSSSQNVQLVVEIAGGHEGHGDH